jgi:phosphate uptake regulator
VLSDAILACGASHLSFTNPSRSWEAALSYYFKAHDGLEEKLKRSDRDSSLCALVSVILSVTELMIPKTKGVEDHMKVSRALIRECSWNAHNGGVAAACFWLNMTMEALSCLQYNWQLAWDPENWGFDMGVYQTNDEDGRFEDFWVRQAVYILAKVINFRAGHAVNEGMKKLDERYEAQLSEIGKEFDGARQAYNVEFQKTLNERYETQLSEIRKKFNEIWQVRDVELQETLEKYEIQLSKIRKEFNGARQAHEVELQKTLNEKYEIQLSKMRKEFNGIRQARDAELQKALERYEAQLSEIGKEFDGARQAHNVELQRALNERYETQLSETRKEFNGARQTRDVKFQEALERHETQLSEIRKELNGTRQAYDVELQETLNERYETQLFKIRKKFNGIRQTPDVEFQEALEKYETQFSETGKEFNGARQARDVKLQEALTESKQYIERHRDEALATLQGQYETGINERLRQWEDLLKMCHEWASNIPRTMQPVGFLPSEETASRSNFPEIWQVF